MAKKILIADDEPHILYVLKLKLSNAGYEIVTAMDGEEALELCQTEHPDLVITDYEMPIMTGLEMARKLHANEQFKSVPVLMLTARGFDIEAEEMAAAGIAGVMSKPFGPREVLGKVQQLLGEAA